MYVGVTDQKGGRFNAHIRNPRSGVRKRMQLILEQERSRSITSEELTAEMKALWIQWLEEKNRTLQERIEHYICAIYPPQLNRIGRERWGTHTGRPQRTVLSNDDQRQSSLRSVRVDQAIEILDPNTRRNFSDDESKTLNYLLRQLGPKPLRRKLTEWYRANTTRRYAPEWIVKNRFIVTADEHGRAICILDPNLMSATPFPRLRNRKRKK